MSLSPIVKKLTQLEKAARKARIRATEKSDKRILQVRVNKIKRAKKSVKRICRAFYI